LLQAPLHAQERAVIEKDIIYGKGGDVDLKLDLARPSEGKGPFPALVFIHPGGWSTGDKRDYRLALEQVPDKGYVIVSVDYRLTSVRENRKTKYPFPAQLNDVKCAVRWLRANAAKYNIDPDHIGALGWSAGAHLALMLGLTEPSDGLEGEGGNMAYSSRIQAVVDIDGPTDLTNGPLNDQVVWWLKRLLGGAPTEVPELYRRASPVTYVRKDSPPILTIDGEKDEDVPPEHGERLDAKMKEAGASHTLIVKKGSGHADFWEDKAVWDFFDRYLKVGR
jgi:acetyl esterase/lipase